MKSAPAFCRSDSYGSLTPKQISICDEAAFRQLSRNWQTTTAANGQAYEIALDTVMRNLPANVDPPAALRTATVVVYISEGDVFKPENVVHFYFDCQDHFQTFQWQWSQVAYAPPLSIAAKSLTRIGLAMRHLFVFVYDIGSSWEISLGRGGGTSA
jgi:hypothetical protein